MMIHLRYFSLKLNDYTDNYWPLAHSIIRQLRKTANTAAKTVCPSRRRNPHHAIDVISKRAMTFGTNSLVAKIERREYGAKLDHEEGERHRHDLYVSLPFDLLYLCTS